jgi:hypothetical protein
MTRSVGFRIEVQGELGQRWTGWFSGMTISTERAVDSPPITTLAGRLADQSALLGILYKLHNLGLDILVVSRVPLTSTADDEF